MEPSPFLGVVLHAIGGLAAASFYIPYRGVKKWAWESYWIVGGLFSWLVMPWVVGFLKTPDPIGIIAASPMKNIMLAFLFGALWGIGGLTFGLSMRYLGMSLGYALALGFCAAFGTIIPPMFQGQINELFQTAPGQMTLLGIVVCLGGIAVCGLAGISKEKEMPEEQKRATIKEFNFRKGVWIAVFCGIMSACMSFGIAAAGPIKEMAIAKGTADLWQNTPVFIIIFSGGLLTNLIWSIYLNVTNRTAGNYLDSSTPLLANYFFAAVAGITWYLQFMFYGMGETQMTKYKFSSWTLHMAFIIVFSNLWGIAFKEWRGSSRKTHTLIAAGILILIVSTLIVGYGNYLGAEEAPKTAEVAAR